jgi:hypothetical protein
MHALTVSRQQQQQRSKQAWLWSSGRRRGDDNVKLHVARILLRRRCGAMRQHGTCLPRERSLVQVIHVQEHGRMGFTAGAKLRHAPATRPAVR